MTPKPSHDAETIAILAAAYVGADEGRLSGLFSLAGISADDAQIAIQHRDPGFLGHILDYVLSSEVWAQEFATTHDLSPEALAHAAQTYGAGRMMD